MAALSKEGLPFQRRSHDRLRDHVGVRALLPYLSSGATLKSAGAKALQDVDGDDERTAEIRAALELLAPLAARHTPDTLLAELALGSEVDMWDPRANRISLLTLHAAKGLEFPVVFIVGCADGLLPLRWPGSSDVDDAEERRLFFVGVSRAQAHLYVSYPLRDNRSDRELRASPFLSVFDNRLADRTGDPIGRGAKRTNQLTLL
jgi:superfamily I DNA/RNA helicase